MAELQFYYEQACSLKSVCLWYFIRHCQLYNQFIFGQCVPHVMIDQKAIDEGVARQTLRVFTKQSLPNDFSLNEYKV